MRIKRTNPDYLNGVPELLVLRLLAVRPQHGYELVQEIRARSRETLQFGEGCIYPLLHRLEHEGLLLSQKVAVAGRSRLVYQVTPRGRARLEASQSKWQEVVTAVSRILEGLEHGQSGAMVG